MSLILPDNLPAIELLKQENIMVSDGMNDPKSHAPALKVGILNLMPIKETTELDLLRLLSNTHLQIEVSLMKLRSHVCKHTSKEHMDMFYTYFDEFEDDDFDGLIITGAPVELIDFEEVDYWEELTHIFRWAETHVQSTLFIISIMAFLNIRWQRKSSAYSNSTHTISNASCSGALMTYSICRTAVTRKSVRRM